MSNSTLNLSLTLDEVNVVMKYLGAGAYVEVTSVVDKIRTQVAPQLKTIEDEQKPKE